MSIGPVPTVTIVNPDDPKGKLIINERDFDPKVHEMYDPLKAQSARAKEENKEPEPVVEEEAPKPQPQPAPKPVAKKAAKRPAKKVTR